MRISMGIELPRKDEMATVVANIKEAFATLGLAMGEFRYPSNGGLMMAVEPMRAKWIDLGSELFARGIIPMPVGAGTIAFAVRH